MPDHGVRFRWESVNLETRGQATFLDRYPCPVGGAPRDMEMGDSSFTACFGSQTAGGLSGRNLFFAGAQG